MSSESATARSIIYLGMDVHKESITIAVLPATAKAPTRLERLPNDLAKLKRFVDRLARDAELRSATRQAARGTCSNARSRSGVMRATSLRPR